MTKQEEVRARVTKEVLDGLKQAALEEGETVSHIVRKAIKHFINTTQTQRKK
jgi:predicted DNA-binding protein